MRIQLLAAKSLVLVRGYADGEDGPWTHPLDPSFRDVDVHEAATPNTKFADYALDFKRDLSHESWDHQQTSPNTATKTCRTYAGKQLRASLRSCYKAAHRPATCILVR